MIVNHETKIRLLSLHPLSVTYSIIFRPIIINIIIEAHVSHHGRLTLSPSHSHSANVSTDCIVACGGTVQHFLAVL